MNFTLKFDSTHGVLLVTLGKVLTKAITLEVHTAAVRFIDDQGPCSGIADFSAVERSELDAGWIRSFALMIPAIPAGKLRVFVAPRLDIYGLTRMFQILQYEKGSEIHVVHSLGEAFALLGLESPNFVDVEEGSCRT